MTVAAPVEVTSVLPAELRLAPRRRDLPSRLTCSFSASSTARNCTCATRANIRTSSISDDTPPSGRPRVGSPPPPESPAPWSIVQLGVDDLALVGPRRHHQVAGGLHALVDQGVGELLGLVEQQNGLVGDRVLRVHLGQLQLILTSSAGCVRPAPAPAVVHAVVVELLCSRVTSSAIALRKPRTSFGSRPRNRTVNCLRRTSSGRQACGELFALIDAPFHCLAGLPGG